MLAWPLYVEQNMNKVLGGGTEDCFASERVRGGVGECSRVGETID